MLLILYGFITMWRYFNSNTRVSSWLNCVLLLGDDVLENRIHKNDLCYFSRQAFRNFDKKNIYRLSFMHSSLAHDIMPTNFMPNVSALIVSFLQHWTNPKVRQAENLGPVQNAFAWTFFHLKETNFLFLLKLYINKTNIF